MSDLTGSYLNNYFLVEQIEKSYEGDTYTAYDSTPMHERHVTLLVVGEYLASRQGFLRRFLEAMTKARELDDPALSKVLDFGVQQGTSRCYVVMETPTGYTLRRILESLDERNFALRLPDIVDIVRQVCEAVELVRINQLSPRDLSPDNILDNVLLTRAEPSTRQRYRVVLMDLGIPRMLGDDPLGHARTEIRFLGSLLYRLVVGEASFLEQPLDERLIPPKVLYPQLPDALERVILIALADKAVERFDSAGFMAADLSRISPVIARYYNLSVQGKQLINLVTWLWGGDPRIDGANAVTALLPSQLPTIVAYDINIARQHGDVQMLVPQSELVVKPGERASFEVQLINSSARDLQCWVLVENLPDKSWCTVAPAQVRLGGRDSPDPVARCTIMLHPPANPPGRAGRYRLRLVAYYGDWQDSDSADLTLTVTRIQSCELDIWPRMLTVGDVGQVTITNRGNGPEAVELVWLDKDGRLDFSVAHSPTHMATMVIDAGDTQAVNFSPKLRRAHWFGRDKYYPFVVEAVTQSQNVLAAPPVQARSHRIIPVWIPVAFALLMVAFVVGLIWSARPRFAAISDCAVRVAASEPMVAVCVESPPYSDSVTVLPGNRPMDLQKEQLAFPAPSPNESENFVTLIAHNWVSRILPFLAARKDISLQVVHPTPTPLPATPAPPVAKLVQFCVHDADQPAPTGVCSPDTLNQVLKLVRGRTQKLLFNWTTENMDGAIPELLPKTIDFEVTGNSAIAQVPFGHMTYTLSLMDPAGQRVDPLSVRVAVEEISAVVNEPLLYMRKSPGQVYEALALLQQGTKVVLLTQPADYQQNEDPLSWVQIEVEGTGEQGWVAYEGLQPITQVAIPVDSATQAGDATTAGASNTTASGSSNGAVAGSGVAAVAGGGSSGDGGGAGAPVVVVASAGGQPVGAAAVLPVVLPEFGPTVTPTPTPTPTETPTPLPTPTASATPVPMMVNIQVEPSSVVAGECINAQWNIVGVKEVYFDFGKGADDYKPMSDNNARSEDVCDGDVVSEDGRRFIYLRWKIVMPDGAVREDKKRILFVN